MLVSAEDLAVYRASHPKWEENNKLLLRAFDPEQMQVEVGWVYRMKDGETFVVRRIDYGNMALTPTTARTVVPPTKFDKGGRERTYYNLEPSTNELAVVTIQKVKDGKPATQTKYKQDEHGFKRPIYCPKMSNIPLSQFLEAMTGDRMEWKGDSPLIDAEARKAMVVKMAEAFSKVDKDKVAIMPELNEVIDKKRKDGK